MDSFQFQSFNEALDLIESDFNDDELDPCYGDELIAYQAIKEAGKIKRQNLMDFILN
ncbi:15300_t:CDS:2 [Racocetra fulgida]|uniref:15300_t:CDS:1 n=1 Tax=Racocetra fulgida TaxID=60492 RepID=A0A9N9BN66_9GLOM|nr:15300_t:CDS:2 [Racocetra fulgida]